jgi:hypothetical protein
MQVLPGLCHDGYPSCGEAGSYSPSNEGSISDAKDFVKLHLFIGHQ